LKGKRISEVFEDTNIFFHFSAPGRINIIGEHTDYNNGYVLPAAINRHMNLAIRKNNCNSLRAYSQEFPGMYIHNYPLKKISPKDGWVKYLKAVLFTLQKGINFTDFSGLDVYVTGDIPVGAGLSSSAALEVVFLFALNQLFNLQLEPTKMAFLAQEAENDFVGVKCGIMDQFISIMSKENHALFLDIQTMDYQYIPLSLNEYIFVLIDTSVSHSLANSEYNIRRQECEKGLKILQDCLGLNLESLSEVKLDDIIRFKERFPLNIYKRVVYVAEENLRVQKMVAALRKRSFSQIGQLLYASHNGLKYLYEVSSPELDMIVDYLKASEGVVGARMMGGGFGGCVLALIEKDKVDKVFSLIKEKYSIVFQKSPRIFPVTIASGIAMKKELR
jgi:galactokinase